MFTTLLLSSLLFGLVVIIIFRYNKLSFYHPIFLLLVWHFFGYILIPWHIAINNDWSYMEYLRIPLHNDYFLIKSLLFAQLGFLSVIIGFHVRFFDNKIIFRNLPPIIINYRILLWIGIFFILFACYGILKYHPIPGLKAGSINLMTKDDVGGSIYVNTTGYLVLSYQFLLGVILLWFQETKIRRPIFRLLTWSLICGYIIFAILRGWHRASWVLLIFGVLSLWAMLRDRRWPRVWMVALALPLLMIFNISGSDRDAWVKILEDKKPLENYIATALERIRKNAAKEDISTYEFNTFQIMLYPEKVPYELGKPYINKWIISAVPRVFLKDKDKYYLETNVFKTDDIYHFSGPCSGIYIDIYCNFGLIGMLIGCFFFGIALQLIWGILIIYKDLKFGYRYIILLYAGFISYFPQLLRDGLGSLVSGYFFILSPIALVVFLSYKTSPKLACTIYRDVSCVKR